MAKNMKDEFDRKWAHIVKKAASDAVFKQKLINHPEQVLRENGIEIPSQMKIKIHENSSTIHHLTLPEGHIAKNLSEEELRKVSGGGAMFLPASGAPGSTMYYIDRGDAGSNIMFEANQ